MNLNLSCVVVTHNSADSIKNLVDSLSRQSLKPTSIIVVDNASEDDTVSILRNHSAFPHTLSVNCLLSNTGGAGGFRAGLDIAIESNPDYIVTFDDDVSILDSNYLKSLVTFLENKELDIASSLVVDVNDHRYTSFYYKLQGKKTNDVSAIINSSEMFEDIKFFNGAIFKANAIQDLKGPKPEFFIRGDEQEFRLRVLNSKHKYKVGVATDAIIYHPSVVQEQVVFKGHNLTMVDHLGKQYFAIRNQFYLYSRAYRHSHSTVKIIRILVKSFYRYCSYYLKNKDYIGLYIWLHAFMDGVSGNFNSAYSQKIKVKYFN